MNAAEFKNRIARIVESLQTKDQDLLLVTPGADLRYLTGYDALPLERLTCLAVSKSGKSWMIVPTLEEPSARAHGVPALDIELLTWNETQDPYQLLARQVGPQNKVLVNNLMWVEKAWYLQEAFATKVSLANDLVSKLRAIKTPYEMNALKQAGLAIDNVHSQMHKWLRPGRTEREVGRDIANAIIESGHSRVDFVIVASGPNGASPHHEVSDRVIEKNEPVVVDIGGTMPTGYCSDSTRMYVCGKTSNEYQDHYEILMNAQLKAREYARAGVTCESVDQVARDILTQGELGQYFIHRTGHGIGLETHEDPYIVSGNETVLVEGHAFSIEPGFYLPGKFGARIEDILVIENDQAISTNSVPRHLVEL